MHNQELGAMIQRYATTHSINPANLARSLHGNLGLALTTAKIYIGELFKGNPYGTSYSSRASEVTIYLDRTAIILHSMGIPADHPIIRIISESNPIFKYPPEKTYLTPAAKPSAGEYLEEKIGALSASDRELVISLINRLSTKKTKP